MQDELKTPDTTTPEVSNKEETKVEKQEGEKALTQADLDRVVQERLTRNTEKLTKEYESKITKAVEEATKLSKLSADEREKALDMKRQEELALKEKDLTLRENKLEAITQLDKLGVPIKFVDFVLSENKDKMGENIMELHKAWTQAISDEVKNQLKGVAPKDVSNSNPKTVEAKSGNPTNLF